MSSKSDMPKLDFCSLRSYEQLLSNALLTRSVLYDFTCGTMNESVGYGGYGEVASL